MEQYRGAYNQGLLSKGVAPPPVSGADFFRGVKYSPFDLVGGPVDLMNMALQPIGLGSDMPVGGSDYLINKYADFGDLLGVNYDRPTGSGSETLGRIAGGILAPTAGAKTVGRVVDAGADYIAGAPARVADRGFRLNSGIDPAAALDDLIVRGMGDTSPPAATNDLEEVLRLRAEQMEIKSPADRTQPSGENPLFDTSPESYERTAEIMPQLETAVPRQKEGAKLPKGDRARAIVENQDAIATRLAERMKPYIGTPAQYFYHTGPLLEKAKELGVSEAQALKQIARFAENYAATSPRTMTENNLRNASLVSAKQEAGIPLTDVLGPGSGGINEKGYPMMIGPGGIHGLLIDAVRSGGIDYNTNPKPATFAENVKGNLQGVTVDTHAVRGALDAMNEIMPGSIPDAFIKPEFRKQYKEDPSFLDPATMVFDTIGDQKVDGVKKQTEYAVFSDLYKAAAKKLGVSPAEAQSLGWFGSGDRTGLASELKTVVDLIDERVDVTAQLLNRGKDEVYKDFLKGKIPLLSTGGAGLLGAGMASEERPQPATGIL